MADTAGLDLKPCPFCGSYGNRLEVVTWKRPDGYVVVCNQCRAQGSLMKTKEGAIEYWNIVPRTQDHIVDTNKKPKLYRISTTSSVHVFTGWQRKDLDANSKNWHYYETTDGRIIHFRSEHMVAVEEGDVEE
ncbi:MAG: hypothetical protein EOM02_06120 [Synergistales bacterium]|nr:hypothetical protein [Synergistales bacterium]